jgi:hypothetical protein
MNKLLIATAVAFPLIFGGNTANNYSTTAIVTLVGAKISASANSQVEKYKRKDCPVCKGKGWYISGDGIAKINCQYCEP